MNKKKDTKRQKVEQPKKLDFILVDDYYLRMLKHPSMKFPVKS